MSFIVRLAGVGLAIAMWPSTALASGYVRVSESQRNPDQDFLHVSGSLYYGMVASNLLNWGGHGQGTLVVTPAIELQGQAYLNFPGSMASLARLEGSMFLGVPYLAPADDIVSEGVSAGPAGGFQNVVEYARIPNAKRKKFGLELGMFFDRHESKQSFHTGDEGTPWVRYNEDLVPVTSIAAFGGLKWIHQTRIEKVDRMAFYIHAIWAFSQSVKVDVPANAHAAGKAPYGGRVGTEFSLRSVFFKIELAVLPSVKSADASAFFMIGWKPDVMNILGLRPD